MKIYKHYFDKKDTPYVQDYQAKQKYHTAWKRFRYKIFLGHKVVKIKLFGIITIYDTTKGGAEWTC
jgi:hypothetical protein